MRASSLRNLVNGKALFLGLKYFSFPVALISLRAWEWGSGWVTNYIMGAVILNNTSPHSGGITHGAVPVNVCRRVRMSGSGSDMAGQSGFFKKKYDLFSAKPSNTLHPEGNVMKKK